MNHTWTQEEIDHCVATHTYPQIITDDVFDGLNLSEFFAGYNLRRLMDCNFTNCIFSGARPHDVYIDTCKFEKCDLSNVIFLRPSFLQSTFSECEMSNLYFQGAHLDCCEIVSPTLAALDLTFNLCHINLTRFIQVDGTFLSFQNSALFTPKFLNSTILELHFGNCFLSNARFNDCTIVPKTQPQRFTLLNVQHWGTTYENTTGSLMYTRTIDNTASFTPEPTQCNHSWKMYRGITQTYEYCVHCDEKKA